MIRTLFSSLRPAATRTTAHKRCRLALETLEARDCPSGDYLLVSDYDRNSVLRYNGATGAFVDEIVPKHSGGLNQPQGLVFGPHDRQLYVGSGELSPSDQHQAVLRYDGRTGGFLSEFSNSDQLTGPHAIIFGPDGNLFVADGFGTESKVVRYNGTTGAFLDDFVPANSGGLTGPFSLVFGPSGRGPGKLDLYVVSRRTDSVKRYDGTTGAYLGDFVASGSGGLHNPFGLTFGPDSNLYVTSGAFDGSNASTVYRFRGPSGPSPGTPMPSAGNTGAVFVASGSGGLLTTFGLIFGPDGNADGRQDLYLPSFKTAGSNKADEKYSAIKRYDGVTGAFLGNFVTANSGGLDQPNYLVFTETDPITLAYTGATTPASAAPQSPGATTRSLSHVHGGGQAALTDPGGNVYALSFAIAATLRADGSVSGQIDFNFGPAFGAAWGAVPGVDRIHLHGRITSFTVAEDGSVTLQGLLTEKDFARGGGAVFVEENVPFTIVVCPGSVQFSLQWCELPTFYVELTDGNLDVRK